VNAMSREQGGRRDAQAIDPVKLALDQLRRAGTDPTVPHQTRHFIYVPGVKAAQNVARLLKTPKRVVEIDTSARTGYWLVVVKQSIVVTSEAMSALRNEFESVAGPVGGEYDRWQVDVAGG
jgi:Regulator of ribonuclease activity B